MVEFDTPEGAKGYAQGIEDSLVNGEIAVSGSTVPIEWTKATETGVLRLEVCKRPSDSCPESGRSVATQQVVQRAITAIIAR